MMGHSHAMSGVAVACYLVPLSPAPWPVELLAVALFGGGALLPDIDHPGSSVARSLGIVTNTIARLVDRLALTIYHATRTPLDPAERRGGHRLITHTYVGSAVFGLLVMVACLASRVSGAVVVALVVGLLGHGTRRTVGRFLRKVLGIRLAAALVLAGVSGGLAYWVSGEYPGWWWLYGVSVALGCVIHREGDWCTNSGVPRRLWPRLKNGRRWDKSKAPATFDTGSDTELRFVRRALGVGLLGGLVTALGGWSLIAHVVGWAHGRGVS
jgi:membrane-bound metal-dependent hydrolase YbcI (DUF457 family)